jgi:hypothetical protein
VNFKVAIFRVKMTTAVFSETLENVYQWTRIIAKAEVVGYISFFLGYQETSLRHSSVSMVSDYRLDDRGLIPGRGKGSFLLASCVQISSEAHPDSYPVGTGGPFPGRNADHSLPFSVEVNNE